MCGAGVSIYWNKMPHSAVQLLLDRSGQVTVYCGATELGQGSDDVLATIVAEVLGVDTGVIRCVTGDTGITPIDLGSYSSRVTIMMGNAALQAAERVRETMAEAASESLGIPPDRVVFSQGRVFAAEDPNKGMSFVEAIALAEAKFGTLSHGRLATRRRRRRASTRARASGPRPRTASPPAWWRPKSTRRPAGSRYPRSGSRTTSAARSTRCLRAGR